jgi:hypothetical protein
LLAAQGAGAIAIYASRLPLNDDEKRILNSFRDSIVKISGYSIATLGISPSSSQPFTVELRIPHASALGDLAGRINTLNYSQFAVQDVGSDRIRVTAAATPDCATWTAFLSGIRQMAWQLVSQPMMAKLFYLSSTDVAAAFSGLSAVTGSTTSGSTSPPPPAPSASSSGAPATGTGTISVNQPQGTSVQIISDSTACVAAGLNAGNPTACGPPAAAAASAAPAAPSVTSAPVVPRSPIAMGAVAVAAGINEQNPPDLLVFSDANAGDDAQILERNRIIAQLDLPRPEMIINAWVMQNSSSTDKTIGAFSNMVKGLVAEYDDAFQYVVLEGWQSLKQQMLSDAYFNEPFRSYISDRFVADTFQQPVADAGAQSLSQAYLDQTRAQLVDPIQGTRQDVGVCQRNKYCLGYADLFKPIKPALTDLLLAIIAAQNPVVAADGAIAEVEGLSPSVVTKSNCNSPQLGVTERCLEIWKALEIDRVTPPPDRRTCAERDYRGILGSLLDPPMEGVARPARIHLQCFKDEVHRLLQLPGGIGLIQAAVADFLFNYKMSQQYPHEFIPYDLSHSADALNNALSPLIDAFNRDLSSYQLFVRADMQYRVKKLNDRTDQRSQIKRLFGADKPSFFNDGLVTVRTISGQATSVNTTSQSYLNASMAPQVANVLSSLSGWPAVAGGGTAATTAGTRPVGLQAATAVLANYQNTFAQIGRSLNITATPRSLNTASAAEIAVTLNADESAGGPTYTGGGSNDPALNTSRVGTHDTTTRIRVDSVKLFEVSSFSAIVERSRSRFPLLPPLVEIPYIGTFAGIPTGPAKEFHASTAVMSAYVVPTAADIAYGLRFLPDLVVDSLNPGPCSLLAGLSGPDVKAACLFRKAVSLQDLERKPIGNFNKRILRCLAISTALNECNAVTFDTVPGVYPY